MHTDGLTTDLHTSSTKYMPGVSKRPTRRTSPDYRSTTRRLSVVRRFSAPSGIELPHSLATKTTEPLETTTFEPRNLCETLSILLCEDPDNNLAQHPHLLAGWKYTLEGSQEPIQSHTQLLIGPLASDMVESAWDVVQVSFVRLCHTSLAGTTRVPATCGH